MIELLRPWALLLAPLPALAWWGLPPSSARAALPVPAAVHALLFALSRAPRAGARWSASWWLRLIGWAALVIALAGPQTRGGALHRPTGRDLIVGIDLSASMGQKKDMRVDGEPVSRFALVRDLVRDLIEQRIGDRVGLIAFSQEAFLIAPLTFDIGAVIGLLDELGIGLPGHRTDLGRAVGLTIQTFRKEPPAMRVLLVISDGEDNTGALAVDDAVRLAAQHDIRIHTIGFFLRPQTPTAPRCCAAWRTRPGARISSPNRRKPWRPLPTRSIALSPRRLSRIRCGEIGRGWRS